MCEIQNKYVCIYLLIKLFFIMWNGGWMVNALVCYYESEGFNSL
jgi:hypothetical protein